MFESDEMLSKTAGLTAAVATQSQGTVGNASALGELGDLLTVLQSNKAASNSSFSLNQADALLQTYLQQFQSTQPIDMATLKALPDQFYPPQLAEENSTDPSHTDYLTGLSTASGLSNGHSATWNQEELGTILGSRRYQSRDSGILGDIYSFTVNSDSHLQIDLRGNSGNQGLLVVQDDTPDDDYINFSRLVGYAYGSSHLPWRIDADNQSAGKYHAIVVGRLDSRHHELNLTVRPVEGLEYHQGDLKADRFNFQPKNRYTLYSGEGNVEFGNQKFDLIDLSHYAIEDVTRWNPVTPEGGGMLYDPGNGLRLFDALKLDDGSHILFEGIDRLKFSDGWVDLAVMPNDAQFMDQWNLHITGVHNAWRLTQGTKNVVIGIQDSGLGLTSRDQFHGDLRQPLFFSDLNLRDTYVDPRTNSKIFHGTAVQGIIAATSNNDLGMSGINWHSDVINIDLFGLDKLEIEEASELMLNYARATGQRLIVNLSLGWNGQEPGLNPELEALIRQNQNHALFVVSSGNQSSDRLNYPANLAQKYKNVVAVGASLRGQHHDGDSIQPGTRANYSNYGVGLSLMAPTEVIATSAIGSNTSPDVKAFNFIDDFNGTSAAAPHVTGIASLVWSVNPNLAATQVHNILAATAFDLSQLGNILEYGSGLVNADAAVRRALALANPVSDWNFKGEHPLSLKTFLKRLDDEPLFGISGGYFEPKAASVATAVSSQDAEREDAIATPFDLPFSLSTFEVNRSQIDLEVQLPEMNIGDAELVTKSFSAFLLSWLERAKFAQAEALLDNASLTQSFSENPFAEGVEAVASA